MIDSTSAAKYRYTMNQQTPRAHIVDKLSTMISQIDRTRSISRKYNSYNYKHIAEKSIGEYVSNEEFIAAARACNLASIRQRGTPNFYFNLSSKSALSVFGAKHP